MLFGYAGKIAWIDLSTGTVRVEELGEATARKFLGGKGLGACLLYRNLKPGVAPLDPENKLIFITGPLTGTAFPAVSRSAVVTKSPMTGTFLDSYAGGFFGPHMKRAGFDALFATGRSDRPVFILLDDGVVSIREAAHLWGLSAYETEARLREDLIREKRGKVSIAAIGQAGERLVRFANIVNDRRSYGRGGAGAVMGSKNLKAVVVRGTGKVPIADETALREIKKNCLKKIAEHPMTKRGGVFPRIGTMMTVDLTHETGTLPTRNWQENTFEHSRQINADAFSRYILRPKACYACPIGCSREVKASRDSIEYMTEGPEYETMYAFGSNCGILEPEVVIAADRLCDEYGMDSISCGVSIAFAMECFEKGLISEKETGGIDLRFGNGDAVIEMIHRIGKREGIGNLLSDGVKVASRKIRGSSAFAMHVKGLELPGYDPRGMKGQGLTYALSDRGGCHLRSNTIRPELLGIPQPTDRYAYEGKPQMIRGLQLNGAAFNCLIACFFGTYGISLQDYAGALSAVTGWSVSQDELRTIAERAWNLTRLFNAREGFGRSDDTLPERLFSDSSTKGPSKGQVVEREAFEKMLDDYYEITGWDKQTGIPTPSKLTELGLEEFRLEP